MNTTPPESSSLQKPELQPVDTEKAGVQRLTLSEMRELFSDQWIGQLTTDLKMVRDAGELDPKLVLRLANDLEGVWVFELQDQALEAQFTTIAGRLSELSKELTHARVMGKPEFIPGITTQVYEAVLDLENLLPLPESNRNERTHIEDPKGEYSTLEALFLIEGLNENWSEVTEQVERLRVLILDYEMIERQHKTDEGMDIYLDEATQKLDDALRAFHINGKEFDISKLCKSGRYIDIVIDNK